METLSNFVKGFKKVTPSAFSIYNIDKERNKRNTHFLALASVGINE